MSDQVRYVVVPGDDALMRDVADLCYETLHAPFGVTRCDDWDELDPKSMHIVALADDTLVGYVRVISEGAWAHVRQLCVHPGHRGLGIASRLMEVALDRAKDNGSRHVYLNARMTAVALYERLGFHRVGTEFPMPRTYLPHVRMERRL